MMQYRLGSLLTTTLLVIFMSPGLSRGHEVVGEVTPLMLHVQHTLALIESGRNNDALKMVMKIYEDFQEPLHQGIQAGIKTSSKRVDQAFGTASEPLLASSIEEKDLKGFQEGLRLLSFLLMLEKFVVLQTTFGTKKADENTQQTIFWLGRNYFSYLLEPTVGKLDPIEEKRLDRLLDRMLYSLEDREWEAFIQLRRELTEGIVQFFGFSIPDLLRETSVK